MTRNMKKFTKQDVETEILKRFVENEGGAFDMQAVQHPEEDSPCDIIYKGVQYQITEGDSERLERMRPVTAKGIGFLEVRTIKPETFAETQVGKMLKEKRYKSDKQVTLLIRCFTTLYPIGERTEMLKRYLTEHSELRASWEHIVSVFSDGNSIIF